MFTSARSIATITCDPLGILEAGNERRERRPRGTPTDPRPAPESVPAMTETVATVRPLSYSIAPWLPASQTGHARRSVQDARSRTQSTASAPFRTHCGTTNREQSVPPARSNSCGRCTRLWNSQCDAGSADQTAIGSSAVLPQIPREPACTPRAILPNRQLSFLAAINGFHSRFPV